ncbi:hypothetical protein FHX08_000947 [Rhizobium sp. BK529]|uniref:hypothetical protein n=1 Tax=unclassified Rhizobium TaxID=2613769 RepID=UPI001051FCD5|nr:MULTISPECIES: hypothetical protein [unclassified Rhizobium]MBB3590603.1 hypothetical protein [Rhizobium sp. BK529]TCS05295.1 hypothetical protein EV281_103977 [Rhizobium sp. BK418]
MTTVYVRYDSAGTILEIFTRDQPNLDLTPHDDQEPAIAKYLRDPTGSEDRFPTLRKWQLWLAALELGPPIFKADVLATIDSMPNMSTKDKETVRIMIDDAQEYSREDPRIDLLAVAMGIPPNQMDDLWRWAAQIEPV